MNEPIPGLILASASTTRRQLLENAGVSFSQEPAQVDEASIRAALLAENARPEEVAETLAETKARNISLLCGDNLVIGADQVLVHDGNIFSKADTRQAARAALLELSGSTHKLISAVVVCRNGQPIWRHTEEAVMTMRLLSEDFIGRYLDDIGEAAFWSVGCYQIEGAGIQLFDKIKGDFFTILGLPLLPLLDLLRRYGCVEV